MIAVLNSPAQPLRMDSVEPKGQPNYINRIRALVNRIFVQLEKIEQRDRDSLHKLKANFKNLSHLSADDQRMIGTVGLMGAMGTFAVFAAQAFVPAEYKEFAKFSSEQCCPQVTSLFTNEFAARQQVHSSGAQLSHTELSAQFNNKQTEDSTKRQMTELLQKLNDLLGSASRP